MNVPIEYSIVDNRTAKEFTQMTFTGYKKIDVIKQFEKSIMENNLESACHWLVELHISGRMDNIWQIYFEILSKDIHINNPHLTSWMWLKFKKYCLLIQTFNKGYEYECRNNQEIRNLLIDILVMLTFSTKCNKFNKKVKIGEKDFIQQNYLVKLKHKSSLKINNLITENIDHELKLGLNEIINLIHYGNIKDIIYWYNWLEKLEKLKKKNKIELVVPNTLLKYVSPKLQNHWVWIIWKYIFSEIPDNQVNNEINALYHIYLHKYSNTTRNKKQYILYHAITLLNDDINWKIPLIRDYKYRVQACCNINQLYKLKKQDKYNVPNYLEKMIVKEDVEYKKINETIKSKPTINIKTSTKTKAPKIKEKDCDKERADAIMMKKLEHFNKLVIYKTEEEMQEEMNKKKHKKKSFKKHKEEYKTIRLR